ncbi:hypothetical protein FXO38_07040 [Capsicum annuum]|nr:hypothetical protein FXO38_07040 [Capsicum annuum]KAF3672686.1 hypothetical protein FXO37_07397 [Capsicum annuum]
MDIGAIEVVKKTLVMVTVAQSLVLDAQMPAGEVNLIGDTVTKGILKEYTATTGSIAPKMVSPKPIGQKTSRGSGIVSPINSIDPNMHPQNEVSNLFTWSSIMAERKLETRGMDLGFISPIVHDGE